MAVLGVGREEVVRVIVVILLPVCLFYLIDVVGFQTVLLLDLFLADRKLNILEAFLFFYLPQVFLSLF